MYGNMNVTRAVRHWNTNQVKSNDERRCQVKNNTKQKVFKLLFRLFCRHVSWLKIVRLVKSIFVGHEKSMRNIKKPIQRSFSCQNIFWYLDLICQTFQPISQTVLKSNSHKKSKVDFIGAKSFFFASVYCTFSVFVSSWKSRLFLNPSKLH